MPSFLRLRLVRLLALAVFFSTASAHAASVIVELNREPAALAVARARAAGTPMSPDQVEAYRATLTAAQNRLLDDLRAAGVAFAIGGQTINDVRVDYRYTLVFNGINLIVDPTAMARILAMPDVKNVHADELLYTTLDVSVPYIRAPHVYGAVKELTRFDHAGEGFEGQGVYVSVIDTGIEWQHEMFGGDPTPPRLGVEPAVSGKNEKVVYYLPLADLAVEDGVGHGTHVASTAAGYLGFAPGGDGLPNTADDLQLHGVAPQARLMSYTVCSAALSDLGAVGGPVGGCLSSSITMAIEDSVSPRTVNGFTKPVANVINMSLGGSGGPDSVTSVASDNAVRLGCVVVAAAGNSGPGPSTAGAPCAGRFVTCVANSIDPAGSWSFDVLDPSSVNRLTPGAVTPASSFPVANGQRSAVQLIPMAGTPDPPRSGVAQYYVFVSGGETPASYPATVAGRIAIVRTSLQATFAQVANSAASAGAIAVIMRTETANPTAVKATIPAAVLNGADFDSLVSIMNAGATPASGTLSVYPLRLNSFFGKTTLNSSSSRGPVVGFGQVKPDVTAPGTNILAAMPPASLLGLLAQGSYGSISGTSMASPHVAGAAALVKQAHPGWTPDMVRTALMNTATNLRDEQGVPKVEGPTTESVNGQGAGLIDVEHAVNVKALMGVVSDGVSTPSLLGGYSFGAVPSINGRAVVSRTVRVTLRDVSGIAAAYNLTVVNSRGLEVPGIAVSAPASVAVPAGGAAGIDVTASIDGSVVTSGDPLEVEWYVRAARQDGGESLSMPFYLRATRTMPPAATMNPVADDATADQVDGVDRDGNYVVSWSYPSDAAARPCGYRLEEARPTATGTLWYDDAEELALTSGNSRWAARNWTTRPHIDTLTLGYSAVYLDNTTATLTNVSDIALPSALVTLTFDSSEDFELDFDYGYVDVSADRGATWTTVAQYTGAFSGERAVDLSPFATTSVRLRFRLVADELISTPAYLGWSIDNIRIRAGAAFHTVATLSATSVAISGKADGLYAYRVTPLFDDCFTNPFAGAPSNIVQIEVKVATAPPTAAFTPSPNPADVNQVVTFDGSASHDNDSSPGIAEYRWIFGDGTTATTVTPVTSHAYAAAGTYRIGLMVIDDDGESASAESLLTVRDPDASISGGGNVVLSSGKASFSLDVTQTAGVADGSVLWNDHSRKVRIKSTRITRVERSGTSAKIYGEWQSGTFVLEVADNGDSGDTASMSAGSYAAAGMVNGGGVTVRE